jgi:hypothetical protein
MISADKNNHNDFVKEVNALYNETKVKHNNDINNKR